MEVILNKELKELKRAVSTEAFDRIKGNLILGFIKDLAGTSQYDYREPPFKLAYDGLTGEAVEYIGKGFLGHLSHAYSMHRAIEIAPHDLWFIVLTELATAIKKEPELCRPLFAQSSEKTTIMIPTADPKSIDLDFVICSLRKLCPVSVDLFIPELESVDPMARTAMYAAFADGVQHYYEYMTFLCGIPKLRLVGPKSDWTKLMLTSCTLSELFAEIGYAQVALYLEKVSRLFNRMLDVFNQVDVEFWRDIYTHKNVGSGGELDITGWITQFFMGDQRGKRLESFLTSVAIVPYTSLETGIEYRGVYGGFKREVLSDGFIKTGYAQLIYMKT